MQAVLSADGQRSANEGGGRPVLFDLITRDRYYGKELLPLVFDKSQGLPEVSGCSFPVLDSPRQEGGIMARRNQNTFLKRQKEIERVRKAKEKMDRRQGKISAVEEPDVAAVSDEVPRDEEGVALPDDPSQDPDGESAADTSTDH
jgi:hypothetical protein